MQRVANKPTMLSVVMLNVYMMSVVKLRVVAPLTLTSPLAYYQTAKITAVKSFIVQVPGKVRNGK
jgi:hypothetical protein